MEFVKFRGKQIYLNLDYSLHLPSQKIEDLHEIQGIEDLKTIRVLYLDNNSIKKIHCLNNFKKLKALYLSNNKIEEIEGLDSLEELEELNLSINPIKKLKGLDNLTHLKYLFIEDCVIRDIEGLDNLKNLEKLWLDNNKIEEIKGLNNLLKLENLSLMHNQIKEIYGLDTLNNLKILDLKENFISKISGLQNLNKLIEIRLENNPIPHELNFKFETDRHYEDRTHLYVKYCRGEYVEFAEKFCFLDKKQLHLSSLGITKLDEVKGLNNLSEIEILNLKDNNIEEIDSIQNLINLKKLWLGLNKIKEIKNLESLTKLEELILTQNEITNLQGFPHLKNLNILKLDKNKIQTLSGIEILSNISELDLSYNQKIQDFSSLPKLVALEKLYLKNTKLNELSVLKNLKNLKELNLSENDLENIPKMELLNLKWLDLSDNNIKMMDPLCQFLNLEYLNLNNNQIDDIKCLDKMLHCLNKFYIAKNKLNRDLYDKLYIADNPGYPNSNNSCLFITYCILKNKFKSINDQDNLEIDFTQLINNSPILQNVQYSKLRDLVKIFRDDYEIRCGLNNIPISIIPPSVFASELDNLLELMESGKAYPIEDLARRYHLCNLKAVKRLLNIIEKNKLTKTLFYCTDTNIIRALTSPSIDDESIKKKCFPFLQTKESFITNIGIDQYAILQEKVKEIKEKCSQTVNTEECEKCGKSQHKTCLTKLFSNALGIDVLPHCGEELADCYWISENEGNAIVLKATNMNTIRQYTNAFIQINKLTQKNTVKIIFFANTKSTSNQFRSDALNLCRANNKNFIEFKKHELIQFLYFYENAHQPTDETT